MSSIACIKPLNQNDCGWKYSTSKLKIPTVPIMRKIVEKLVRLQIKALHGGDPSDLDDRQFYLSGLIGIKTELSSRWKKNYFAEFNLSLSRKSKR